MSADDPKQSFVKLFPLTKMAGLRIEKTITLIVGAICVVIAAALILLLFWMVSTVEPRSGKGDSFAMLVSVIAPFALVFTAFGWGILTRSLRGSSKMYSPTGWRVLAGLSAGIGVACMIASGPIAILVPGVLAVVLLMQDEWIKALLFGSGGQ